MKLAAKLALILVLAITILFALDGYYTVQREVRRFEEHHRLSAGLLGVALQNLWLTGQHQRVLALIKEVNRRQSVVRLRWVWLEAAPDGPQPLLADAKAFEAVLNGGVVLVRQIDPRGRGRLLTYVRVTTEQQRPGGVERSEPWPHRDQQTIALVRHVLAMTGLMALVGGIVVYFVGTEMVGRPLGRLIEKTRRVGRGDLSEPLHLRGHDELSELAQAFNAMCDQLAESRDKAHREEEARMAATEQLRHANRLRTVGGLASGIAHELGTPLNVVSGRAGSIASGKLSPEEVSESATTIKTESQRMTTILRQLLDFARRNTPHKTRVDLRQIATQTVALLESTVRKQDIAVQLTTADDAVTACVDAGQIQQVLTNLIVNGVQSMPGGGQIDIGILRRWAQPPPDHDGTEGRFLCMDVRDQGPGISAQDREHLFEPFFTTKGVGEGTGLGLSIAYGIVQEHGGWIDVQTEVGKGSCFSVYLPEETES